MTEDLKAKKRYNAKKEWVPVENRYPRNGTEVKVLYSDGTVTNALSVKNRGKFSGFACDLFAQPAASARALMWRYPFVEGCQ